MLGFQTDWDFECLVFDWTQIGVVLRQLLDYDSRRNIGNKFLLIPITQPWHESNAAVAGDGAKLHMMS